MFEKRPINPIRYTQQIKPDTVTPYAKAGVQRGFEAILSPLLQQAAMNSTSIINVAIDGTHGARYQHVLARIIDVLEQEGYKTVLIGTNSFMKTSEELRTFFEANITDNRAFGYFSDAKITDYFIPEAQDKIDNFKKQIQLPVDQTTFIITFGPGAYWLGNGNYDITYFLDVSREYQQLEHKAHLLNLGFSWNRDVVEKYKICLFVEWPVLETYRKEILDSIHYYVDMNEPECPKLTTVFTLRQMIADIAKSPMRVKPFFAPGIWGGQYLKKFAELPKEWANCAWSFEPIAPENSILLKYNDEIIEVPFLIVMHYEHPAILGNRIVGLFGDYFPIRFDYLDTIDGDSLSCQVHPKQEYIRETFNEFMAQQESYYIMENLENTSVFLGLTEQCTKEEFFNAVHDAQETGEPIQITDFVNQYEANKGDLFLIPTGTVHASGKNNLVLEISSTTWWFTFKIYDFLRKGMDGKPRPINIEHAFDNIDFDKKTAWVEDNLIPKPSLLKKQGMNEEYVLGQREDLLFYVHRVHLHDTWEDHTNNEMVMYNLVEGEKVRIVSCADESIYIELQYAESYILPAVFGAYKIINIGNKPCKLVKAGVSKAWDVSLL
jgi:mannose-6-phosphate isomerase class I